MKNQSVKTALLSTLLLSVAGFSGVSSAHDTGPQTLGAALASKDIYRTTCFAWGQANGVYPNAIAPEVNGPATKFQARFLATAVPANSVNVRVTALGSAAPVTVGPGAAFSTSTEVGGDHYFVVSHNTAVASNYTVEFHCFNAANVHTGTGETFSGVPFFAGGTGVNPTVDFIRTQNQ